MTRYFGPSPLIPGEPEAEPARPFSQLQVDAFLAELSALSRKHGIEIGACGCCKSPWLIKLEQPEKGHYTAIDDGGEWGPLVWGPVD
jgi:hypothetical protein